MIVKPLFIHMAMIVVCNSSERENIDTKDFQDLSSLNDLLEDDVEILKTRKNKRIFDDRLESEISEENYDVSPKKIKFEENSKAPNSLSILNSTENIISDDANSVIFDHNNTPFLNDDIVESSNKNYKVNQTLYQINASTESDSKFSTKNSDKDNENRNFYHSYSCTKLNSDNAIKSSSDENENIPSYKFSISSDSEYNFTNESSNGENKNKNFYMRSEILDSECNFRSEISN